MSSTTKIWIIIAFILIITGMVLFAGLMFKNNFNFSALDTTAYVTNTYNITDDFTKISVTADTADIDFKLSTDNSCRVVCFEKESATHTVNIQNGALVITYNRPQSIKDTFSFINVNSPKITVYLPNKEYGELVIKGTTSDVNLPKSFSFESITIKATTSDVECRSSVTDFINIELTTGDVALENITANNINITSSTGDIEAENINCKDFSFTATTGEAEFENIKCENLNSSATTGDITAENCIASGTFSIVRDTGDVTLKHSDAAEFFMKTTTGDVMGSINTPKIFITKTDTGRINVPSSVTGGKCEITTDTGDKKIIVL